MDLTMTDAQEAFRDEVRAWLAENAPREPLASPSTPEGLEAHKQWDMTLYKAGYSAIHWPSEYGGRDAPITDVALFQEEYARADAPTRINALGLGLAGPTIMAFGTDEQKEQWLPGILSSEDLWCQGFSEPDAGSDLANVATSAIREGDTYIVNGQKVWTSLGRYADWMFTLVRTDPGAPKHKGITFVMIPMDAEGIDVRPIVQINGDPGFAEVFLDDVRVPVANVIGEENDGWRVAMATLGFERGTGLGSHVRFSKDFSQLVAVVRAAGRADDPIVRDQLARLYAETEVYRHHTYRNLTTLASGKGIGPEASLNKLYWSEMEVRIYSAGLEILGELGELGPKSEAIRTALGGDDAATAAWDNWHKQYWYSRAACIYAGTSEIQKNIISELVLGLPKEPKV